MVQEVEMTYEEKMKMYRKLSKKELAAMLIQANIHIKLMQPLPIYVPYSPQPYWGTAPIVHYDFNEAPGITTSSITVN
jgi:hypothetical protein